MLKNNFISEIPVFSGADINQILDLAQKSHENYLIRANKNDLDRALLYYLEAMKINPSIPQVYYKLASLLWEKGDIDLRSAIEKCQKAVELDPKSPNAYLYLGYFLKAAGKYEEAEKAFKSSIKLSGLCSSKPRMALSLTIIRRLQETSVNFSEFIKAIYFFLSGALMSLYDYDVLRMLYRSNAEDWSVRWHNFLASFYKKTGCINKTLDTYEKAAHKTGRKDIFFSKIGDMLVDLRNPHRAAEFYREALATSHDDIVLWAKLAELLQRFDKHNFEEIIDCYNQIVRLEPANANLYYELGHLYLRKEDKFSAVNSFKRAIELEPKNAFFHNSLAYALVQLQDYDGAISEYERAIRINPDKEWTSIVAQALGAIYHQVKDNMDAAIVAYQMAIALDSNNIDAYIALGEAYQDKNDIDGAIDCFCNAVQIDPNVPKLYCNLGLTLWEKGCVDEAIIAYHKAINLNPKYEIAFNNLGVVYLDGANKADEAIIMFTQAIKHNPNYALAYYNKARCYEAMKNNHSAAKYYQMALDISKFTGEIDEQEVQDRLFNLFAVA
jgi:tetratricopeptide (TPR) repeat protein